MMKKNIFHYKKGLIAVIGFSAVLFSCSKNELLVDANYPEQTIGIAQAAVATVGPGANGIYSITPKINGQAYRFIADVATSKFNIPLGVIRSGVDLSGLVSANIAVASDTITKLVAAGKLVAGTEMLPSTAYTLPASVDLQNGASAESFTMAIDLNFLVSNIAKKYAIAVGISSPKTGIVNRKLSTAVIFIDPAQVLLPVANFSSAVDNISRTGSFINISANGITYSWNFGDGSPAESTVSPSHKYSAPGTYTVTLTATGITGTPTIKTTNIVIL